MIYLMRKKPENLTKLIDNLVSTSITEVIIKIITIEKGLIVGIDEDTLDVSVMLINCTNDSLSWVKGEKFEVIYKP